MRLSRLLFATLLLTGCAALPVAWAPVGRAAAQDEEKKKKADPDDTEKALADLKKALDDTKKELATLKTQAADTKKAADKVDALTKELDKLAEAAKTAVSKKDIDAVAAEVKALQAAGGDAKDAAKKLADIEKAAEEAKKASEEIKKSAEKGIGDSATAFTTGKQRGDTAWILVSSAFVLLMVPGLALFYGGMVRRKNVLATMMQSMAALAVVGVYWIAIGYAMAFGPSVIKAPDFLAGLLGDSAKGGGLVGWSWDLFFLKNVEATTYLGGYDIPVYLHVMFQGMFAIITPALISGAIAERIRFWPFCIFMILWVTFVYCPLAHMVWAFDWFDPTVPSGKQGASAIGLLGKAGALDFAGGTVVHIAAGMAGLACCLVLGKRAGYPQQVAHPNSMVLTLLGAGLLWMGWFGFNGGSALNGTNLAVSAFTATQVAAAAAGLGWMLVEWLHKGKPTALGLASGIVAGLVAVTPASGYVYAGGAACIGLAAAIICYLAVALKNVLGYDDSLDAFGVHGVGGFVGAVLTGVFCSGLIQGASADGLLAFKQHRSQLAAITKDDGKMLKDAQEAAKKADDEAKAKEAAAASQVEGLTKAVDEAQKKFNDAEPGKREELAKALTEAKDKLKEVTGDIDAAKDAAAVKADAVKKIETDKTNLQALADKQDADGKSATSQLFIQIKAAVISAVFAFVASLVLCALTHAMTLGNFKTDEQGESDGLDRTEHGEVGFDFSGATESVTVVGTEPRAASEPRGNGRFEVQLTGVDAKTLMKAWTDLCQPSESGPDSDFLAVYPYVTTVRGTTFRCRGGDPAKVAKKLESLFTRHVGKGVTASAPVPLH
jgi:ammonium transporter